MLPSLSNDKEIQSKSPFHSPESASPLSFKQFKTSGRAPRSNVKDYKIQLRCSEAMPEEEYQQLVEVLSKYHHKKRKEDFDRKSRIQKGSSPKGSNSKGPSDEQKFKLPFIPASRSPRHESTLLLNFEPRKGSKSFKQGIITSSPSDMLHKKMSYSALTEINPMELKKIKEGLIYASRDNKSPKKIMSTDQIKLISYSPSTIHIEDTLKKQIRSPHMRESSGSISPRLKEIVHKNIHKYPDLCKKKNYIPPTSAKELKILQTFSEGIGSASHNSETGKSPTIHMYIDVFGNETSINKAEKSKRFDYSPLPNSHALIPTVNTNMKSKQAQASPKKDGKSQDSAIVNEALARRLEKFYTINSKEMDFGFEVNINSLTKKDYHLLITTLKRAIKPTFQGSVSPDMNMLDIDEVSKILEKRAEYAYLQGRIKDATGKSEREEELMLEYSQIQDLRKKGKSFEGLWSIQRTCGFKPNARERTTTAVIGKYMYLFGGFSRELYNDVKILNLRNWTWENVKNENEAVFPPKIYGHSMVTYKDKLYIFGGSGKYNKALKLREVNSEVLVFDAKLLKWEDRQKVSGIPPARRFDHACSLYGNIMVVHGGFSPDEHGVLDDLCLFNLDNMEWMRHFVSYKKPNIALKARYMHTLTAVVPEYHLRKLGGNLSSLWYKEPGSLKQKEKQDILYYLNKSKMGIYLFGGSDSSGKLYNDVWLIHPNTRKNHEKLEMAETQDTKGRRKPKLYIEIELLEIAGKPPLERVQHSTCFFQKYLVVHGGRNDNNYKESSTIGLNDIALLNLDTYQWESVLLFGFIPDLRWAHTMVAYENEKIILFGGINMNSYCNADVYTLITDKTAIEATINKYKEGVDFITHGDEAYE